MIKADMQEGSPFFNEEKISIQKILDNQVLAWNKKDAIAYAKDFSDDGNFTNILGSFAIGKEIFIEKHERIFKTAFSRSVFQQELVYLIFVRDDVAIAESLITIKGLIKQGPFAKMHTDEEDRFRTQLMQVIVKENGIWKISAYHNVDVKSTA